MEVLNRLTNKVGPLPAWAWAAIPAAAYVAYSYYRAANSTEDAPVEEGPSTEPTGDYATDGYGVNNGASLPGYGTAPNGTSNIPPVETPKLTNETWFRQASNYLIGEGVTSTDVVTALNAYLYGSPQKINSTQMSALQRALIRFGVAPDPAFVPELEAKPTTPAPKPTPKPTTKPVAKPNQPRNVKITKTQFAGIYRISWAAPSGGGPLTTYVVQKQFNAGAWQTVAAGASWFADINGVGKGMLTARVAAVGPGGQSGWATATIKAT